MELFELLLQRRSVRHFRPDPIPEEVVAKLLAAANNAPSGGNIQPVSIVLVEAAARRKVLAELVGGQPWVENAPLSMVFCLDFYRVKRWSELLAADFRGEQALIHFLVAYADLMCAAQNVVVLAEDLGLGSVYIGSILSGIARAREFFRLPAYVVPMMVLTLGYPRSVPSGMPKLRTEVIVHREEYRLPSDAELTRAFEDKYGTMAENTEKFLEKAYIEAVEADKQTDAQMAARVVREMERLGIKNNAQFLFQIRYPPAVMIGMNTDLKQALRQAGFDFFA